LPVRLGGPLPRGVFEPAVGNGKGREVAKGLSIVIPAHDEEAGLAEVVRGIHATLQDHPQSFEIIVVDDGSTDRTGAIAASLDATVIAHAERRGYGAALKTGIRAASGDQILICDADGTYPPDAIPSLLAQAETHDMVVGARTGPIVDTPLLRRIAKGILRRLASYLSEFEIPDLNSGLRVFRKDAVVPFFPILPSGFSFTTTITLALLCNGGSVAFVPINYHRRKGRSKIQPIRETLNFSILILRTIIYFNPLRVFAPISLLLGLLFLISLGYDLFVLENVTEKSLILLIGALQLLGIGVIGDVVTKRWFSAGR
jgi:glycosyltransferase involved in cell wall biosynthesis